jgi:aspartyl/glutamyl-tRNA(Asn/Gln) amidotransferase, C subunit
VAQDQVGRLVDVGGEHRAEVGHPAQYHPPVAGLTRSDVEHVAYLARLRLTDEELDRLEGQLNHILDQYAKLSELDTSAIPPTAQTIELENILREDVASPSLPVEAVLRNARTTDGDFIVVPPILGGDAS